MKKPSIQTLRKHGHQARLARQVQVEPLCLGVAAGTERLKTLVTFESGSRSYLWITDRKRSRPVVKH